MLKLSCSTFRFISIPFFPIDLLLTYIETVSKSTSGSHMKSSILLCLSLTFSTFVHAQTVPEQFGSSALPKVKFTAQAMPHKLPTYVGGAQGYLSVQQVSTDIFQIQPGTQGVQLAVDPAAVVESKSMPIAQPGAAAVNDVNHSARTLPAEIPAQAKTTDVKDLDKTEGKNDGPYYPDWPSSSANSAQPESVQQTGSNPPVVNNYGKLFQ